MNRRCCYDFAEKDAALPGHTANNSHSPKKNMRTRVKRPSVFSTHTLDLAPVFLRSVYTQRSVGSLLASALAATVNYNQLYWLVSPPQPNQMPLM